GRLRALAPQVLPFLLLLRGGGTVPAGPVLFVEGDLADRGLGQPDQVAGHQPEGLFEVDRAGDGAGDVRAHLELLGVASRLLVEAGCLDRDGDLGRGRAYRLHPCPVERAAAAATLADL